MHKGTLTYHIQYDDGDEETHVPAGLIRSINSNTTATVVSIVYHIYENCFGAAFNVAQVSIMKLISIIVVKSHHITMIFWQESTGKN